MADTYKISDYTLLLTVYGSKVNINAMCKQISLNSSTLFMTPAVANIEWSKVPKYATPFLGGLQNDLSLHKSNQIAFIKQSVTCDSLKHVVHLCAYKQQVL